MDHKALRFNHETILAGQAVFTSSQGSQRRGYRLVARSSEIREPLARRLSRWGPAHGSLLTDAWNGSCFNYVPIDDEWAAISRTVYGGSEYSRRGAPQVVTLILALNLKELSGYSNSPIAFARTAMLLGYLRLSAHVSEHLPNVHFPARAPRAVVDNRTDESGRDELLARCLQLLIQGERIALIDGQSAANTMGYLLEGTPVANRLQLSFTTGLKPSPDRSFRIHLLPFVNSTIHRQLSALGIRFVASAD